MNIVICWPSYHERVSERFSNNESETLVIVLDQSSFPNEIPQFTRLYTPITLAVDYNFSSSYFEYLNSRFTIGNLRLSDIILNEYLQYYRVLTELIFHVASFYCNSATRIKIYLVLTQSPLSDTIVLSNTGFCHLQFFHYLYKCLNDRSSSLLSAEVYLRYHPQSNKKSAQWLFYPKLILSSSVVSLSSLLYLVIHLFKGKSFVFDIGYGHPCVAESTTSAFRYNIKPLHEHVRSSSLNYYQLSAPHLSLILPYFINTPLCAWLIRLYNSKFTIIPFICLPSMLFKLIPNRISVRVTDHPNLINLYLREYLSSHNIAHSLIPHGITRVDPTTLQPQPSCLSHTPCSSFSSLSLSSLLPEKIQRVILLTYGTFKYHAAKYNLVEYGKVFMQVLTHTSHLKQYVCRKPQSEPTYTVFDLVSPVNLSCSNSNIEYIDLKEVYKFPSNNSLIISLFHLGNAQTLLLSKGYRILYYGFYPEQVEVHHIELIANSSSGNFYLLFNSLSKPLPELNR